MKARILALLVPLLLLPGCNGLNSKPPPPAPLEALQCIAPVPPFNGFVEVDRRTVPQGGIVGLQIFYKGPHGVNLSYTSGILMDMYESAPASDSLRLTWGGEASLFKRGKVKWILFWYEDNACHQYTIGGDGFTRDGFIGLLTDAGVLAPK